MEQMTKQIGFKKSEIKKQVFAWISLIILLFMLLLPFFRGIATFDLVSLALVVNGVFGTAMLWRSMADAPYSLKQVHWVFYVTFFAIAPLNQYALNKWPWGYTPTDEKILAVCGLTLVWGLFFAVLSRKPVNVFGSLKEFKGSPLNERMSFRLTSPARFFLAIGCIFCTCLLINLIGFENMFLRTTAKVDIDSSSLKLVANVCLRAFIFGSFALLALSARKDLRQIGYVIIAGCCLIVTCFPTALPRFNVAAIYLGLAIFLFPFFSKRQGLFSFTMIIGFLIAYPLFNAFKYIPEATSLNSMIEQIVGNLTSGYTSGNYDAFSNMFWIFDYIELSGITWGSQLVGSLMFFIPRSLWPTKPVPSGELVFSSLDYHFTDMSCALPWEGYINFGVVGLIVFACIYGYLVGKIDLRYWNNRLGNDPERVTTLNLYYPFLLCLTFYLLRGAMMTTFTYIFGDLAVMFLLFVITKMFERRSSSE